LSEAPETVALSKFACPACGGEATWNPARQKLVCPFCGTESPAKQDASGAIVEHDLVAALRGIGDDARGCLHLACARILREREPREANHGRQSRERRAASDTHRAHVPKNVSIAARVTRHCVPIFLPLRSPESRLATTSASLTPSICATCAGV